MQQSNSPKMEESASIHDDTEEVKHTREEVPTGWLTVVRSKGPRRMIDAFMDIGKREVNKSELAALAGLSWNTVEKHIDDLVHLGVVEELTHGSVTRYQFNIDSEITQAIIQLDAAATAAATESDTGSAE